MLQFIFRVIYYISSKKQKSKDTKEIAIKYYLKNNVSQEKVSEIFGISRQTLIRWSKQYESNNLDRKQRITPSYKVKQKHVVFALNELKKNNSISIAVL